MKKVGKNDLLPSKKELKPPVETRLFPIVGIGASAGGLEALEQFFSAMPANCGMAFVIIQHLDPNHADLMPELLQRNTSMKVSQATDGLKVKPDSVYVIPPNKSLSILHRTLHLFDPVGLHGLRLPVDIFFRSLAQDMREKSIGIILSGMGSDGSLGLKQIKEGNGLVLVQDPASAKFDAMPRNAINAVIADIIAPAGELPARLLSFLKFAPIIIPVSDSEAKSKSSLDKIIILLREQWGHDFSLYKKTTLFRRIHQIEKIQNYVRCLQENPKEVEILFKELLIGVTSFFRDIEVWEALGNKILPQLLEELPDGHVLRAWVTGCSTGEEAYSLAILLKEAMGKLENPKRTTIQIFATDLDNEAVDVARRGVYPKNIAADVSPEYIQKYFTLSGDKYRVNTVIREMVVFALQNVIKDPPFTKLDLITCRNLLIYMESELQQKLIGLFHYSLDPGGILLLGTAEALGKQKEGFDELDPRLKIYRRNSSDLSMLVDIPSSYHKQKMEVPKMKLPAKGVENIQVLADQILLQNFAPPSVLVNPAGDIIYITGHTGKYLEPIAGKANWNIFAMGRGGLSHELPGAFRKVLRNYDPLVLHNIMITVNERTQLVDITIQQIEKPDALKGMVMIVFKDLQAIPEPVLESMKPDKNSTGPIRDLKMKLQKTEVDLKTTREEMQASQEELRSTNEELQSTNEELQSTNEELTTSKEEMQSLNEELRTVNNELQSKVNDFVRANDDMENMLNSTEIAILFLDKDLNIRRFTDPVTQIIKLRPTDIGRPFTDLVNDLHYPEIGTHARQVLKTLKHIETSISSNNEKWFLVRIIPYRTSEDNIDGLVITFNNITVAKKLEHELLKKNEILRERK